MRKLIIFIFLAILLIQTVWAVDLEAPEVPYAGAKIMPQNRQTFGEGLLEMIQNLLPIIRPDLAEASRVSAALTAAVLLVSISQMFSEDSQSAADLIGVVTISVLLFRSTHSLIQLGYDTVLELSEYEKLLLPVLTAAIAAHGGLSRSTALYAGTAVFNTFISKLLCTIVLPMIYLYLALAIVNGVFGENMLGKMKELFQKSVHWVLRTILTCFTGYMGISGAVSGTADAAALKAARTAISTVVPVVGGILADASEAVLIGAQLVKNSAGIYGIYAILAIFLGPFFQIGIHYLVLKLTAAVCTIYGTKKMCGIIDDFSSCMGLILAITGSMCLLLLISCICFLKGTG